jgi:ribose/xylose/arabinose/galactoside ABC-type transport system permease subunit
VRSVQVCGRIDLASAAIVAFAGLAVVQLACGQVGVPALALLWYAVGAARMAQAGRLLEPHP